MSNNWRVHFLHCDYTMKFGPDFLDIQARGGLGGQLNKNRPEKR